MIKGLHLCNKKSPGSTFYKDHLPYIKIERHQVFSWTYTQIPRRVNMTEFLVFMCKLRVLFTV